MTVRALQEADFAAAIEMDERAFGYEAPPEATEQLALPLLRSGRPTGGFEDGRLVSLGMILNKEMTLPGGAMEPVAAVTWVAVNPDAQGRGLLRELMRDQLHGLHDAEAEPIAILTASESGIYGRFGYGMAAERAEVAVPCRTAFRPSVRTEPVRELPLAQAMPRIREIYDRVRPTRVGYLSRSDLTWFQLFGDLPFTRRGGGALQTALHPDGFVSFRIEDGWNERGPRQILNVHQLCAATPVATASLWGHLLSRALAREVRYLRSGPGEVLRELLVDPRAATVGTADHLWLRLVDLERAVPQRSYRHDLSVVIDLRDELCPWNAGIWSLELAGGRGSAVRTDAEPQLALDISELGAAFLGGTPLTLLAAAGLVEGDAGAIAALGDALGTARAPYCPEIF